jgi:hypothetical protein
MDRMMADPLKSFAGILLLSLSRGKERRATLMGMKPIKMRDLKRLVRFQTYSPLAPWSE